MRRSGALAAVALALLAAGGACDQVLGIPSSASLARDASTADEGAGDASSEGGSMVEAGKDGSSGGPDSGGDGEAGVDGSCGDASTSQNCGTCGHDCQGGACSSGVCQPVPLVSTAGGGNVYIALDANNVYWAANGGSTGYTVNACAKKGCNGTPTPLITVSGNAAAYGLAVSGSNLVWTDGYQLFACAVSSCGSTISTLAMHGSSVTFGNVAADTLRTYWGVVSPVAGMAGISACTTTSCTTSTTALANMRTTDLVIPLGVNATYVAWIEPVQADGGPLGGQVLTCPLSGCGPTGPSTLFSDPSDFPGPLTMGAGNVYWAYGFSILACPTSGCGASPTTVYGANTDIVGAMGADDARVYWALSGSSASLYACPLAGCGPLSPAILATGQNKPQGIVADDTAIYWIDDDAVMKLVK